MGTQGAEELVGRAAFAQAYRQHAGTTHRAAFAILGDHEQARDVTQDVFLRLWRSPEAYDPRRADLAAYLRLRARSRALDVWRRHEAAQRALVRLGDAQAAARQRAAPEGSPAAAAELHHDRAALMAALCRLPASQREAVVLAFWAGLTADEVSQRAQVPLGTAKSRIRLGVRRLSRECRAELAA